MYTIQIAYLVEIVNSLLHGNVVLEKQAVDFSLVKEVSVVVNVHGVVV
jgi:hypothetical protein